MARLASHHTRLAIKQSTNLVFSEAIEKPLKRFATEAGNARLFRTRYLTNEYQSQLKVSSFFQNWSLALPPSYEIAKLLFSARSAALGQTGNCGEMSEFAFSHLAKSMVFPLDLLLITTEENPCDAHSVCVIGRNAKSDLSRPENWGNDCVICDPWSPLVFPAADYIEVSQRLPFWLAKPIVESVCRMESWTEYLKSSIDTNKGMTINLFR
ncbi:hypothetical protein DC094_04140 [Pelagibaculum spongiae]|uniref:Uncharacterized protein n=2 Tax=Pelagibaculum spongiae TaxID=2080658 RepID=A0A2V1H153_9GAMM|nr:hypothetical protein DC094_04140 [Pelagibaculum spongiae]